MQIIEQEFSEDSLKDYYKKLSKGEKSKLLTYLSNEYQIPAATLQAKFSQNSKVNFRYMEVKMFSMEIECNKSNWENKV